MRRERVLFLLYSDAGLRPSEGPGIWWEDFDAVSQTVRVERAVTELSGAEGGTRTPTPLRAHDPESCASANSATSARAGISSYGPGQ